jgi:hypothetical protein
MNQHSELMQNLSKVCFGVVVHTCGGSVALGESLVSLLLLLAVSAVVVAAMLSGLRDSALCSSVADSAVLPRASSASPTHTAAL